jgi:predicted amidohydrolase
MVLRLALLQQSLVWQSPEANRRAFGELIARLAGSTDLIVLPEMFTTGFTMEPAEWAEAADGPTVLWLREQADASNAAITGSVAVRENDRYVNRLYWVTPGGTTAQYDKRHLFRMGDEHSHYAGGIRTLLVEWRGFRIAPLVCYDLRFPVWSRRRPSFNYDLMVYVANWPAARRYPWQQLLRARAIENQAFVAGCNRVGSDGQGVAHAGDSVALDFLGKPLAELADVPGIITATLDLSALRDFREQFPAHLDADRFTLEP